MLRKRSLRRIPRRSLRRSSRRSLRRSLRNKRKIDGVYNDDILIYNENQGAFNNQMRILDQKLQEIKVIREQLLAYTIEDCMQDSIQEFIMKELFPHRIYVNQYTPADDDNTIKVELSTKHKDNKGGIVEYAGIGGTPFYYWKEDYENLLFEDNAIGR